MSLSAKLRRAPLRIVTGAYIANSGWGKLTADAETAEQVHGLATGTYPFLGRVSPRLFVKGLAVGELAVGGALLAPFVSPVVAGAALSGFSGALLNLYWQTPGMHAPGDPRPTPQGLAVSKDVWMFGIGAALVTDGLLTPAHDKKVAGVATLTEKRAEKSRQARRARKRAEKANRDLTLRLGDAARAVEKDARKRAERAAAKARKRADKATSKLADTRADLVPAAADRASSLGKSVRGLVDDYGPVVAERARDAAKHARGLAEEYGPVVADRAKQARDAARDTASDLADQYGPLVAERADQARKAAKDAADHAYAAVR